MPIIDPKAPRPKMTAKGIKEVLANESKALQREAARRGEAKPKAKKGK